MTSIRAHFISQKMRTTAFSLLELLVVIGIIVILAALLLPALSRAKSKARNIACVSQLKQLGVAARLYAEDNSSRLPAAELLPSNPTDPQHPLPRINDVLASYVSKVVSTNASAAVFKCPSDNDWFFEAEGSSYQWNAGLNGHRIDFGENSRFQAVIVSNGVTILQTNGDITRTAESTPLFLDYDDFHPRPPKSGKNVVYMDGHATAFAAPVTP
jgi:type II secretory pathway pseudopilin PulG